MARKKLKTPMPRGSKLLDPIKPPARGPGAPTLYKPEYAAIVTNMCLLGLTDEELAVAFKCDIVTLDGWKREIPEFAKAIRAGRDGADETVARALYLKACGYEHPEDDIRTVALGNNQGSEIVITPTVKRYAPDTQAAQLWLHNRQRKRWQGISSNDAQGFDAATVAALMRAMHDRAEEDE